MCSSICIRALYAGIFCEGNRLGSTCRAGMLANYCTFLLMWKSQRDCVDDELRFALQLILQMNSP